MSSIFQLSNHVKYVAVYWTKPILKFFLALYPSFIPEIGFIGEVIIINPVHFDTIP